VFGWLLSATWQADCSTICDFLQTALSGLLEGVLLTVGQRLWSRHDGAPAHYGEDIRQWLNSTYPGRRVGCRGSIA
jgi:hypothetical protein